MRGLLRRTKRGGEGGKKHFEGPDRFEERAIGDGGSGSTPRNEGRKKRKKQQNGKWRHSPAIEYVAMGRLPTST